MEPIARNPGSSIVALAYKLRYSKSFNPAFAIAFMVLSVIFGRRVRFRCLALGQDSTTLIILASDRYLHPLKLM